MRKYIKALLIATMVVAMLVGITAGSCEPAPTPVPGAYLASMTSAQFASTITNESGTGLVILGTSPTITTPIITTINPSGTAVVTLPTATTTLVGRDTTDTLTNKTLTSPVLTTATASGTWTKGSGTLTLPAFTVVQPTITDGTIGGTTAWNSTTTIAFSHLQLTRGDTFVPASSTTYTVTHGLGTTPNQVMLTWQSNPGVTLSTTWVSNKGATTFQVNIPAAEAGAPSTIGWLAVP